MMGVGDEAVTAAIVSVEEAQARLPELISQLLPGTEVVIRDGDRPVARLLPGDTPPRACRPGSAKELLHWMAPDFDAPLDDFREYMP